MEIEVMEPELPTLGDEALPRFIRMTQDVWPGDAVPTLDVGAGHGRHAHLLRRAGLHVITLDTDGRSDITGDFLDQPLAPYSAIWCCHTLEHTTSPGAFLQKLRLTLIPGGVACITVPPMRTRLVSGHVNLYTEGSLVYNMILAGWDCSRAAVGVYGYNISILLRRRDAKLPADLTMNSGDIERLAKFFPWPVRQGIDGRLGGVRW